MVKHSVSISRDVMMVIRIVQGHTAGQQQVQDAKPGLAFLPASITVELFYLCTPSVEGLVLWYMISRTSYHMNVTPNTINYWGVLCSWEFQALLAVHKTVLFQTKHWTQIVGG